MTIDQQDRGRVWLCGVWAALLLVCGFLLAGCRPTPRPPQPAPPPPPDPAYVAAIEADCAVIFRAELQREIDPPALEGCRGRGLVGAAGWQEDFRAWLQTTDEYAALHAHFDPSSVPLEQLARLRGAMWTARLDVGWGPRPGRPDNILALDFYALYSEGDRARLRAAYRARGYTHGVVGPMAATDCYHWQYPCHDPSVEGAWPLDDVPTQAQWDRFLDRVQELWDGGIAPVYFHKPDGWERPEYAAKLAALDALARQPRAQQLLRLVVYPGWEPSGDKYGWTNATWTRMAQRGADVFPHALRLLHTPCDLDAPTGQNDDVVLGANGNAISWQRVAPYIHGWLMQVCGYVDRGLDDEFRREWPKAIDRAVRGFRAGIGGWPTSSAWGANRPVLVYAAEYASFRAYWSNAPESDAIAIGDLAMGAGADGYLDGGTLPVGDGPVPWQEAR